MYKILIDYGSDGWKFEDYDFKTIDEAVKSQTNKSIYNPFLVIKVIEWEACEL
jgi:hypothetical protein